jgi:hypothetical protein
MQREVIVELLYGGFLRNHGGTGSITNAGQVALADALDSDTDRNMRIKYKPSRPPFREITVEEFEATHDAIAIDYPDQGERNQIIANTLIKHYLGGDWINRYVHHASRYAKYLKLNINESLPVRATAMMRYWEFAETLLNLQNAEGFETVLDELMCGKVESACGELDLARMISFHELRMKFVKPTQGTKDAKLNYDFEIFYSDGFKVCAEAAAKFEDTKPRASSITGSLKDSRDQLPDGQPSVIFVKVPQHWIQDTELARQIINVANGFLLQSRHVMSIKYYTPVTVFTPAATARWHAYSEVSNPKFPDRDWNMFKDETVPVGGMPLWWMRFFPQLRIPSEIDRRRGPIQSRGNGAEA